MKINIPSLDTISKGKIEKIEEDYIKIFKEKGETDLKYISNWLMYKKTFFQNVVPFTKNCKIITDSFFDMMFKHNRKLIEIYFEEISKDNDDFLNFSGILFQHKIGCVLKIKSHLISFIFFDKHTGIPLTTGEVNMNSNNPNNDVPFTMKRTFFISECEELFTYNTILHTVFTLTLCVLFEKLIDGKEVIIVPPRSKKTTKYEKYVNDNSMGIEIWDSRMFNSYVRLEGFSVSGHFRHQPVGTGRTGHKLIWINEFEKHGYNTKNFRQSQN